MIAIMQPTFLPWIGYFNMISKADKFVFLDSVQFNKRSWQQRNKIKTSNGEKWLSVPVISKGRSSQLIYEVEIQKENFNVEKVFSNLDQNYAKAPYYKTYRDSIFNVFQKNKDLLCNLNIDLILELCKFLEIEIDYYRSSKIEVEGKKAELLVDICKYYGENKYLSAVGSREYIEDSECFKNNNINVIYNEFVHPAYRQMHGDFLSYMSIVDLLFNEGERARRYVVP